jgi:hypothetical protein
MKINLDRLCKLAGVKSAQGGALNEASNRSMHDDQSVSDEVDYRFGQNQLAEGDDEEDGEPPADEALYEEEETDEGEDELQTEYDEGMDGYLDEVIEVDEAMLVQELRRAKSMLSEASKTQVAEAGELSESQLRSIVAEEVKNIMKDFNLTAGWIYGDDRPQNSKAGQVITSMPGLGFKNSGRS